MKHRIKIFFKYFFLAALIAEVVFLIAESLMPGKKSSEQSSAVGGVVDDIITDIGGDDEPEDVLPEEISIKGGDLVLNIGKKKTLALAVVPENASASHLKTVWSSDNETVAEIRDGVVFARAIGSANITVSLEENSAISDTVCITVREIFAESLSLKFANGTTETTVAVGSAVTLQPVLSPSAATAGTITYQSEDANIATVSAGGAVKGISVGTTTVTANYRSYTEKNGKAVTLTSDPVTVNVVKKETVFPTALTVEPVSGVEFDAGSPYLYTDDSASFKAVLSPAETTEKDVLWSSSDEKVLTVDAKGKVTPVGKGKASVTATAAASPDGPSFSYALEVRNRSLGVTLYAGNDVLEPDGTGEISLTATAGKHFPFSVSALPGEVYIKYASDDARIAEIDDGMLLPYRAASVKLYVTVADNAEFSDRDGNLAETFTLSLTVRRVPFSETVQGWALIIRKLFGHFGAFLLLGLLAGAVGIFFERKDTKWRLITLVLLLVCGFAFAGLTEILQMSIFTAGRGPSFRDVLIDFCGYAPAVLLVYGGYLVISAIVRHVRRKT